MKKIRNSINFIIGFIISALFLYLAFQKVEFQLMIQSLTTGKYIIVIPVIAMIFLSHWVRAVRWKYFLNPIKKITVTRLFSALMVGYLGNSVLPAHLGEFFRAFIIGRKEKIPASSVFATIVIERIVDLFSLLAIMAMVLVLYSFPNWLKEGGYLLFILTICFFMFLVFLKRYHEKANRIVDLLLKYLPARLSAKIKMMLTSFLNGIKGFNRKKDYAIVLIHTIIIWVCYIVVLYLSFCIFRLIHPYNLTMMSATLLMVITTIGVVIPTSPGYIGTYHLLCQLGLELLGVPRTLGLTYAIVVHAINFFPVILVGIIFAWKEGINLVKVSKSKDLEQIMLGR